MKKLKQYLPPLFTLALIALGAAMPWLAAWVQDARIGGLRENLELNAVNLTLQQDVGVGPALKLITGEYIATPWKRETRMTEGEAFDAALDAIERMSQYYELFPYEAGCLLAESPGWAEPLLVIAEDDSTALVWSCYWEDSPCVVTVDDASGKMIQFLLETPAWLMKEWDAAMEYQREEWNLFFLDYYGETELEDVEGLHLEIYEDYTSFNF